jgi:hypothetical protein
MIPRVGSAAELHYHCTEGNHLILLGSLFAPRSTIFNALRIGHHYCTPPHPSGPPVRPNALDLYFKAIEIVILVVVGVRCTCGCGRVDEVCELPRERVYRRRRRSSSSTHLRPRFHLLLMSIFIA